MTELKIIIEKINKNMEETLIVSSKYIALDGLTKKEKVFTSPNKYDITNFDINDTDDEMLCHFYKMTHCMFRPDINGGSPLLKILYPIIKIMKTSHLQQQVIELQQKQINDIYNKINQNEQKITGLDTIKQLELKISSHELQLLKNIKRIKQLELKLSSLV